MNINKFYEDDVRRNNVNQIERKYKLIKFDHDLTISEVETVFDKYVLDKGWPWKFSGGRTKPIDNGNNWVIKYMDCFGRIDNKTKWILVDKKSGQIQISDPN